MELDYSLTTPEERVAYTKKLLKDTPPPYNNNTLKILADYILFTHDRNQTKKERTKTYPILTPNREFTIDKRQVSYEGLAEKLENGEDGLYNLIRIDKGQILDPKDPITEEDIETIPGIKECMDVIASLKNQLETAKVEVQKDFSQEQDLKDKQKRLSELNAELNIKEDENEVIDDVEETKENKKELDKIDPNKNDDTRF